SASAWSTSPLACRPTWCWSASRDTIGSGTGATTVSTLPPRSLDTPRRAVQFCLAREAKRNRGRSVTAPVGCFCDFAGRFAVPLGRSGHSRDGRFGFGLFTFACEQLLAQDRHALRRLNPDAHPISLHFQHLDRDVVRDHDPFASLARQ